MISLDTEATGLDLRHGARPFLVTTCNAKGENTYWEWPVDPLTRKPIIPRGDLQDVQKRISRAKTLVLQNSKFDFVALWLLFQDAGLELQWDWSKVRDTLISGHLIASNKPHDLTSMVIQYLDRNIEPLEKKLERATKEAQSLAKDRFPDWRLAKKGLAEMPSAKEKVWKYDSWLPAALALKLQYEGDHPWRTVCSDYANGDSTSTLYLWIRHLEILQEWGLEKIYQERMRLLEPICLMEHWGITINRYRLNEVREEYTEEAAEAGAVCQTIAEDLGCKLELPAGGRNESLASFLFGPKCEDCGGTGYVDIGVGAKASCDTCRGEGRPGTGPLGLRTDRKTKAGELSLDKYVLADWEAELEPSSKASCFVRNLGQKRKRDTALTYLEQYERFWLPWRKGEREWCVLHPSLNPTGADTLRFACENPNAQQISKQEVGGKTLRYCLGPAPGREWWALDAKNLELRIPAYEAGEEEMVAIFERPDDPPYYGSYHLLVFDILHPDKFAKHGAKCKDEYGWNWYQWVKNGNFAVGYGSVESSGTADRAYHVPGAFRQIKGRFKRIHGPGGLNERMIAHAQKYGYVETIPDKSIGSTRGYPLYCSRGAYGRVLPTVPLNYHVQGTAMWWMCRGMVRCYSYLKTLGPEYRMVLQVHDELLFDFPRGKGEKPWLTNLPIVRKLQRLMESGGKDIDVPTPVSVKYHAHNWSEGIAV